TELRSVTFERPMRASIQALRAVPVSGRSGSSSRGLSSAPTANVTSGTNSQASAVCAVKAARSPQAACVILLSMTSPQNKRSPCRKTRVLVGLLIAEEQRQGLGQNLDIEPEGPVTQVVEVVIEPSLDGLGIRAVVEVAVNLCEPGQAGRDLVIHEVAVDELPVRVVARDRVRSRTDEAHTPL